MARVFGERHFPNLPYYRPVTRTTLLLQRFLHDDDPAPFHLFNAVLMGAAGAPAYLLLRLDLFRIRAPMALACTAIFALHPAASSCVYSVSSGRETLTPAVWTLAAVYAWLRGGRGWRWAAYLFFAGALFSTEQAAMVPALFALADVLRLPADPAATTRAWLARCLPLLPILAVYAWIRLRLFGGQAFAFGSPTGLSWALAYALEAIVAPFAALVYEPTREVWLSLPRLSLSVAAFAGLEFLSFRRGRPVAAWFWSGWFLLTTLPTANILWQEALFDERYVFLPSLALLALAGMAACASISIGRAAYFQDNLAFSTQWLRTNPNNVNAHFNLGLTLAGQRPWAAALPHYWEACGLQPTHTYSQNNLGSALFQLGRTQVAQGRFEEALRIEPGYADAHLNLGLALARRSLLRAAAAQFAEAARLNPDRAEAHSNLSIALAGLGDTDGELAQFRAAVLLKPRSAEIHNNLANALVAQSRFTEAVEDYRAGLRLRPDCAEARSNLDILLHHPPPAARALTHGGCLVETKRLGTTELNVSRIGLGCVTFGREIDEAASFAVMDHAAESGISLFDTAESYGGGASERIVGRWLRSRGMRDRVVVESKISGRPTKSRVAEALEASLQRLQLDRLDAYLLHVFDESVPLEETLEALTRAAEQGKICVAGCSNFTAAQLARALDLSRRHKLIRLEVVQPIYNLAARKIEEDLLPLAGREDVAVVTYSPLGAGFLSGKYTPDRAAIPKGSRFDVKPGHADIYFRPENFQVVECLRRKSAATGVPMVRLAMAWVLQNRDLTSVLVGARSPDHISTALEALSAPLPEAWKTEMDGWPAADRSAERNRGVSA